MFFFKIFCSVAVKQSAKVALVRAEKNLLFKIQDLDFSKTSHFKCIFELKTVYFAYKPISDGLF